MAERKKPNVLTIPSITALQRQNPGPLVHFHKEDEGNETKAMKNVRKTVR